MQAAKQSLLYHCNLPGVSVALHELELHLKSVASSVWHLGVEVGAGPLRVIPWFALSSIVAEKSKECGRVSSGGAVCISTSNTPHLRHWLTKDLSQTLFKRRPQHPIFRWVGDVFGRKWGWRLDCTKKNAHCKNERGFSAGESPVDLVKGVPVRDFLSSPSATA
jgi:hypothetical protein